MSGVIATVFTPQDTDCAANDDEDDDRKAVARARYLTRVHDDLNDRVAFALAYRELGYSRSGIAAKVDVTESTARKYMGRIERRFGRPAIETKTADERTGRLDR